jgi:uncharacterized protein YkwD
MSLNRVNRTRFARTLSEKATAVKRTAGAKPRISREKSLAAEVRSHLKSSPYLFFSILILIFSANAFAQKDRPEPILFATVGGKNTDAGIVRERLAVASKESSRPVSAAAASAERQAFELLNAVRQSNGLPLLRWNSQVAAVARVHSQDMARQKYFSHRGLDGSMVDDRADSMGLGQWRSIGENIAYLRGFQDPVKAAVDKWMHSPDHRRNLLADNWKESGIGIAITQDGTYYLTQVFLLRK